MSASNLHDTIKSGDCLFEVDYLDLNDVGYKLVAIEYVVAKVTPTTAVLKTSRYGATPARHGLTRRVGRVTIGRTGRYQATAREAWLRYIETQKQEIEAREREVERRKAHLEDAYLELGKVVSP